MDMEGKGKEIGTLLNNRRVKGIHKHRSKGSFRSLIIQVLKAQKTEASSRFGLISSPSPSGMHYRNSWLHASSVEEECESASLSLPTHLSTALVVPPTPNK